MWKVIDLVKSYTWDCYDHCALYRYRLVIFRKFPLLKNLTNCSTLLFHRNSRISVQILCRKGKQKDFLNINNLYIVLQLKTLKSGKQKQVVCDRNQGSILVSESDQKLFFPTPKLFFLMFYCLLGGCKFLKSWNWNRSLKTI